MLEPVAVGAEAVLDELAAQSLVTQSLAYFYRTLATSGMVGHEVFDITPVIQEAFGMQCLKEGRHYAAIVTFLQQLSAQFLAGQVPASQRVERGYAGRAGI